MQPRAKMPNAVWFRFFIFRTMGVVCRILPDSSTSIRHTGDLRKHERTALDRKTTNENVKIQPGLDFEYIA